MENKRSYGRVRSSYIFGVLIVLLFCAQCGAYTVGSTEELSIGTGKDVEQILGDWLDVYGTVNMYAGAYVESGIYAYNGSTVNIYAGDVGEYSAVTVFAGANVTVYGTGFAVDNEDLDPSATQFTVDPLSGGVLTGTYENDDLIALLFYSDIPVNIVNTAGGGGPEPIGIDIKPGSYPNVVNVGSHGVIPVAILSTETLDATTLPAENVFLAGSGVAVRGKGNKYLASEEDVNGDELIDLVVKVETENLEPGTFQDGKAVLRVHETSDKTSAVLFEGSDDITIVPPE